CADLVLLNKTDTLTSQQQDELMAWLKTQVRPGVKIIPCQHGQVSVEILLGQNMAVEDDLTQRPSHHDEEHDEADHDQTLEAAVLTGGEFARPELLTQRLQAMMNQYEIYRVKGWVNIAGKPLRLIVQGVGTRLNTYYDRPWLDTESRKTQVVVIGRNLPENLSLGC
ncbi:MAG: GTP-binding protein, partial [Gloeomargarita sp. HHBFW_bins_162]